MKTRYFKSGILAAAAALLCSAALVSCTDDVTVGEWDGAGSIETGLNETGAMLQDLNSGKSNTTVELWKETYTADLRLVLTKTPSEGFTARAKVDDSYDVGQYNKANGTNYTLYPADKVTFANDGLFAAAGRNVELTVEMTVHAAEGLVAGRGYLIPVALEADGVILKESHCFYVVKDMTSMPTCYKGDDLPKGFLFFEVNDVNPLNALTFELEDGRLLWDVVCLFSGNINHHADRNAPFLSLNPQTQYWMDNNEVFIQPLRKRGIKVIMCVLGNHDQSGVAQLSDYGCQMFAKELATFCEAYNIDGVCFDDEYSNSPDLSNPYYASRSSARAARLAYESKKAMPDKLVVAYCYSSFHISSWPTEIEGQDIAEWVDIAQGQHDPEEVLGHLDGVQPRYGRQLHQRRCRGYAQPDHRQGLVHGLRTRSAEEYQRQGGQECLAQYFRQPAEQGSRNSLRFAAQGAGALLQVRRHPALYLS